MEEITYDEFAKVKLVTARIKECEQVEGSDKLLKIQLDVAGENRQIVAGIGVRYNPADLIGKNIMIVANLKPRTIMGIESNGMLLAASGDDGPVLLTTASDTKSGLSIK